MTHLEPRTPSVRIVARSPERMRHQQYWPEVEVTRNVTVRHFFSWGTDSATYTVVARHLVDIRNGHTRQAFEEAQRDAYWLADRLVAEIREGHPNEKDDLVVNVEPSLTPDPEADEPVDYRTHFTALFRAVAACEPPEGSQLDDVLVEFQSTYEEAVQ